MGTRGLKVYRWRGRYFVYYNHWDSYPEGLGSTLVADVPVNPHEYREWLESLRAHYSELTDQLESEVLLISEQNMRDLLAVERSNKQDDGHQGHYHGAPCVRFYLDIDDSLEMLPTGVCDIANNLWIEWVYLFDLDRELFCVDNWISFDLQNIPRDRWIKAWGDGARGKEFYRSICPEGSSTPKPPDYFAKDVAASDQQRYIEISQEYDFSQVKAIGDVAIFSRQALQQIIAILLFQRMSVRSGWHIWDVLPFWGHDDFAFREVAFAVLSIATNQFYFEQPDRFYSPSGPEGDRNGYLIDRNGGSDPKLMPLLGSGCHLPGREPGSAPTSSMYWFQNVLVSLVPNTVFENGEEAAIGKMVEFGLRQGAEIFQGLLFSISHAVFLEINTRSGSKSIRRTKVICILDEVCDHDHESDDEDTHHKSDDKDTDKPKAVIPLEELCRRRKGFASLQNFFDTACRRNLPSFTQGVFPNEIYGKIVSHADPSTRRACTGVARNFRALCQEYFTFSPSQTVVKCDVLKHPMDENVSRKYRLLNLDSCAMFTFQYPSGHYLRSGLGGGPDFMAQTRSTWNPVIGGEERPSLMSSFSVNLRYEGCRDT